MVIVFSFCNSVCKLLGPYSHTVSLVITAQRDQGLTHARDPDRDRICKPFKKPRNRFLAWRAATTTLFDLPARQATQAGGIGSLESIAGLLKRLQIRAQIT
jgi:hypothetical protein